MLAAHRFIPVADGLANLLSIAGFQSNNTYGYTIAADTWASKTSMPSPGSNRPNPMGGVINGLVYVFGGNTTAGRTATGYVYDPGADTWTAVASLPVATDDAMCAVYNGLLYVFGGNSDTSAPTNVCRKYNPATDSWSTIANLPIARSSGAAATIGSKIYLTAPTGVGVNNTFYEYNPGTDSFTSKTGITNAVEHHAAATDGTYYYAIGGQVSGSTQTYVQRYDPSANTWSAMTGLPLAVDQLAAVGDEHNGKLYVTGGSTNNNNSGKRSEVRRYDVATDSWTSVSSLPGAQYGHILLGL